MTVAASNTIAALAANADYVCDGTADNVEIQAALDTLDVTGGTVVLLPGAFTTSSVVALGTNQRLVGSGWGSRITYSGSGSTYAITSSSSNAEVSNLYVMVSNAAAGPVSLTGGDSRVAGCYLLQNGASSIAAVVLGGTGSRINLCHVVGFALGVEIPSGWDFVDIGDNYIEANTGVLLNGCSFCIVHDNQIRGASQATGNGILLQDSADDNAITANVLTAYGVDGIRLVNVGAATPDRNNIQDNMCRETLSGGDGYGINVLSGVNNLITNNDLLTSGALGSFNDAGTGTITVAGNRV